MGVRVWVNEAGKRAGVTLEAPRNGDAGHDLRAAEAVCVMWDAWVRTGLHIAIPEGYVGLIRDRSSMAAYRLYTHAGVIDSSYRGEIRVLMENCREEGYSIRVGDKIAQLVIVPVETAQVELVGSLEALGETERGGNGFGSTGRA